VSASLPQIVEAFRNSSEMTPRCFRDTSRRPRRFREPLPGPTCRNLGLGVAACRSLLFPPLPLRNAACPPRRSFRPDRGTRQTQTVNAGHSPLPCATLFCHALLPSCHTLPSSHPACSRPSPSPSVVCAAPQMPGLRPAPLQPTLLTLLTRRRLSRVCAGSESDAARRRLPDAGRRP